MDFPLLPSIHDAKLPNELRRAATTLLAATHIVLVLPLWYGKLPLKMSAFVRQVIRPSSVFQFGKKRVPLELEGRSCRIIVLTGTPVLFYRLYYFTDPLNELRRLKRDLASVGIAPIRENLIGMFAGIGSSNTSKLLQKMRELGANAL